MHKTWGEPEKLAVPPNFSANTPSKACNGARRRSLLCGSALPLQRELHPHAAQARFQPVARPLCPRNNRVTFLFHRVSLFGVVCILATQHCYFSIEIFGFQAFRGILWTEFCGYRTVFVIFDKNSQITQLNFRVGYGTMTILNYGNGR